MVSSKVALFLYKRTIFGSLYFTLNPYKVIINFFPFPTPEHYLPLLYTLGLIGKTEELSLLNDKLLGGPLSMTLVNSM